MVHTYSLPPHRRMAIFESTMTVAGQTTLPRPVRDSLVVRDGDRLRYLIVDEGVLMLPVRPNSRLFGSLKYDGPPCEPPGHGTCHLGGSCRRGAGVP